jgi:PleD family two-component response regulator
MATDEEYRMLTKKQADCLLEQQQLPTGMDKIKILVAEDDHTTQMLYDKGLFNQIFDKKMVVSGKEAIFVYNEWHPEIILLDIYLSEMTGYQVLKVIRSTFEDKKTCIVMATSLSGSEDILSCMKLGIEGYIVKPFQCMEIGAKILNYYAKRVPELARSAEALCREIARQSQVKLFLDKDQSMTKEESEGSCDDASDKEIEESGAEKEAVEKPKEE